MEVVRKRRASTEVQELMNAVLSDYEFFAKCDSSFQSTAPIKRQRSLSDNIVVQCSLVRPTPLYNGYNLGKPLNEKSWKENNRFNEYEPLPELIHVSSNDHERSLSRGRLTKSGDKLRDSLEKSREQGLLLAQQSRESLAFSRDQSVKLREHEQVFQKITPDFWASQANQKSILRGPFTPMATRTRSEPISCYTPRSDKVKPGEFICLSSEPFISPDMSVNGARKRPIGEILPSKPKHLQPVREIPDVPPLLIRADTNTTRAVSGYEAKSHRLARSTQISVDDFPSNEPLAIDAPTKIRRTSLEGQETSEKKVNVGKRETPPKNMCNSDSEDELIIVESPSSPVSRQLSDDQSPANHKVEDNHMTGSQTNKKPKEREEALPIERKTSESRSPANFSPTDQIWPDYVITRVGSLLWLDKEVVYPVTLDEMRRRVQDPENFSFQMLIAYVRHSRAKGRQFLDYWKCQPSGKTSRPNVLSKLCEADARELVKGIHKVNEKYFPHETLAKHVAADIVQEKEKRLTAATEGENQAKESLAHEKVKAIEKSR